MRFMVLVKATKDSESGNLPNLKMIGEMGKFNEELIKAGVLLDADSLQSTVKGGASPLTAKSYGQQRSVPASGHQ